MAKQKIRRESQPKAKGQSKQKTQRKSQPKAKVKREQVEKSKISKTRIFWAILTLLVTIGAAWYTVNRSEKQAILAETERARSVRNDLVSIVEEHIITQTPLDCVALMRLIEFKSREEKLVTKITARNLVEQAEYNILSSRYLDVKQKETFRFFINQLYRDLIPADYSPFKDIPHAALLNKLALNIQERKKTESLELLNEYVHVVNSELILAEKKSVGNNSFLEITFKSPLFYTIIILYLLTTIFIYWRIVRYRTRRRYLAAQLRKKKLENEFENFISFSKLLR